MSREGGVYFTKSEKWLLTNHRRRCQVRCNTVLLLQRSHPDSFVRVIRQECLAAKKNRLITTTDDSCIISQ